MKRYILFPTMLLVLALVANTSTAQAQSPTPSPSASPLTRPRTVTTTTTSTPSSAPTPQQQIAPTPVPTPQNPPLTLPPTPATSPAQATGNAPSPTPTPLIVTPAPQLSMNKIRARIAEAQRLFKTRPVPTATTATPVTAQPSATPSVTPSISFVTLAALDPETSQIHQLTLLKETFLTRGAEATLTSSLGATVRLRVLRANGVNTAVTIIDGANRMLVPLVVEFPIERNRTFREMAYYTSAHPALLSPEVVKAGQSYVRTMVDLAAKRLKDKGIVISPNIIDVAERLCIVEHADHDRFRRENNLALFEEIFALFALNELDTYRYSVSWAGAGGMVQMIPATYRMVRQRHPGVGLNPDFVLGMRNHGNALEAMLLYMQDTWNDLVLSEDVAYALDTKIATQPELLAAGYNSNPARLPLYIRRGGAAWRTLIPRETQVYLQIYRSLDSLVSFKSRS